MSPEPLATEMIGADLVIKRYDEHTVHLQETGNTQKRVIIPDEYTADVVQFLDAHATPTLAEAIAANRTSPFAATNGGER